MIYSTVSNSPDVWNSAFPNPPADAHKYDRGHVAIFAAPELSGATRLAASACSRIGAGLVTVCASTMLDVYRAALSADIMVSKDDLARLKAVNVMLGGAGGISKLHQTMLFENEPCAKRVFDSGALPIEMDWHFLDADCVLTPHQGEFRTIFPWVDNDVGGSAAQAAKACGSIVVLKGACTAIAHPDGRLVINNEPNPYLAKAGTGDVLAGFIAGLLAQGMPSFEAVCAAVWIHSRAGDMLGPGLTACDLEFTVPEIYRELEVG